MKKADLEAIHNVLRYVSTADPGIQAEVLRLHALITQLLQPKEKKTHE
jgi:hypothetical protein